MRFNGNLQCGYSGILPLEIAIKPLHLADEATPQGKPTHMVTYSNLDKLLDECGPGAEKAQTIAWKAGKLDNAWDTLGQIVDDAVAQCLEKRGLMPEACRHGMIPLHNEPVRSFEPEIYFRCGGDN